MPGESTPTAPTGQPGAAPVAGDPDDPVRVALQRTNRHPIKLARLFVNAQREQAQAVADLTARLETATRALAAYEALGTPETLTAAVQERDTLTAREAQRTRAHAIRAQAEEAGYAPRIVERLSRDPDAAFDVTGVAERERDGTTAKTLLVRRAGTTDEPVDLDTYAAQHFAEFAETIRPAAAPASPATPPRPAAPAYPAAPLQTANGGSGPQGADVLAAKARDLGAFV